MLISLVRQSIYAIASVRIVNVIAALSSPCAIDPSSPLNITITNKTSTSLTVEWSPPLTPNGVILSYQVSYVGLESVNPVPDSFETNSTLNTNGTMQIVEVVGLSPYSQYSLSVKAFTSAGGGEETTVTFQTEEDCKSAQDHVFR